MSTESGKIEVFGYVKWLVVCVALLGTVLYAIQVVLYGLGLPWAPQYMTDSKNHPFIFGLPISALSSFAIVCVLEKVAPARKDKDGVLEFEVFGTKFTGPAGPTTLWMACYALFVASMWVASSVAAQTTPSSVPHESVGETHAGSSR